MTTTLFCRALSTTQPALWAGSTVNSRFSLKDDTRRITAGADTLAAVTTPGGLSTTVGAGTGVSGPAATTVTGPTAGKFANQLGFFSPPLAADITISGTVSFAFCGTESSMNADTCWHIIVYRCDEQGALTQIISSEAGTEIGTTLSRISWTGSPSSTNMKKGDRLLVLVGANDATALTMATGFAINMQYDGATASTADSNVQFTENLTFTTTDAAGTVYFLRDTASDISPGGAGSSKALNTVQGSGTATAAYQTIAGPITFPGTLWTLTAGGTTVEWYTPTLNTFTLGGVVAAFLGSNSLVLETSPGASPNQCLTMEIAVVTSAGASPTIWARSYTSASQAASLTRHLSGPDLSVPQGSRLRFRVYSDDCLSTSEASNKQVAGTTYTWRYDGTVDFAAALTFTQTITEGSAAVAVAPYIVNQAPMRAAQW